MDLAYEKDRGIIRSKLVEMLSQDFYDATPTATDTLNFQLGIRLNYLVELCIHQLNHGISIDTNPAVDPKFKGKMQHVIIFCLETINHDIRIKFQFHAHNPRKPYVLVVSAKKHFKE